MKILVTGGAGYIGSVVVRDLISRGYEVVIFDDLVRGHLENIPRGVKFHCGSLCDLETTSKVFCDELPDAVIHFAALAYVGESMQKPQQYFENNVSGGINLLTCMERFNCRRIVFSSSCATYGVPRSLPIEEDMPQFPTNPYGQTKLMFEQIALWLQERSGLRPTFLRYFNAAGAAYGMVEDHLPETHLIPNVLKVAMGQYDHVDVFGGDYPTPDGTCIRDYVHVKDLSVAHVLAIERDAVGAFNLGTGNGVSVMEVINTCRKVTGRRLSIKMCPRRPGDPPALYASGMKARDLLGWSPSCSDIETIVNDAWIAHQAFPNGYQK